jgi:hypothetical protein
MATGDNRDYTGYVPTSSRVASLQHRLEEFETAANEHDEACDERFADVHAEMARLRWFCMAFGILVLVMVIMVSMIALGMLRVGG